MDAHDVGVNLECGYPPEMTSQQRTAERTAECRSDDLLFNRVERRAEQQFHILDEYR
jgi:hypothetical protein